MSDLYVHGIVMKKGTGELQEIRSPSTSVVGAVGTAPQGAGLTVNEPAAFLGKKEALAAVYPEGSTGDKGTLYDAILGVQEQGTARIVLIRAASDSTADMLKAINLMPSAKSVTGFKPKILTISGAGNFNPTETVVTLESLTNTVKAAAPANSASVEKTAAASAAKPTTAANTASAAKPASAASTASAAKPTTAENASKPTEATANAANPLTAEKK